MARTMSFCCCYHSRGLVSRSVNFCMVFGYESMDDSKDAKIKAIVKRLGAVVQGKDIESGCSNLAIVFGNYGNRVTCMLARLLRASF